jgi:polyisoprenoid-binding protein YceI
MRSGGRRREGVMVQATLRVTTAAIVLWAAAIAPADAEDNDDTHYTVDCESSIVDFTLSARRALFTVHRQGQFRDFTGDISYDPANPAATQVDLTVYTDSVNLDNVEQEDLLRSDEFFDVETHPTMHFASTAVAPEAAGELSVTGDLTIRGITRRLTVPIRVMPQDSTAGTTTFDTTFQIDRTQFGLIGGGPRSREFKVSIGKNVAIHMAIAARRALPSVTN